MNEGVCDYLAQHFIGYFGFINTADTPYHRPRFEIAPNRPYRIAYHLADSAIAKRAVGKANRPYAAFTGAGVNGYIDHDAREKLLRVYANCEEPGTGDVVVCIDEVEAFHAL